MKFSDLSKKSGSSGGPPKEAAPKPPEVSTTASPDFLLSTEAPRPPVKAPVSRSPSPAPSPAEESEEAFEEKVRTEALEATEVYAEAVTAARDIHRALEKPMEVGSLELPREVLKKLISVVRADNQELLTLADRSAPDNYLHGHVVNVAIFSLRVGLMMKMSDDELLRLAMGAILHDIGMVSYMPIVLRPTRLSEDELKQVQRHSEDGVKLLAKFPSLQGGELEGVTSIVSQVHERMAGAGYPSALGQDDINRLAKVVGVCDMYESLTHMRAWRSRLLPHHVLRVMIEEHERTFEPGLVKVLVEALSLYPPGSFVRLSSGDVGRVVAINSGLPTRPKVKVLVDAQGQRVADPRVVNLATHPILYISDAVDETKLPISDQRLLLELRAQRWWVKSL